MKKNIRKLFLIMAVIATAVVCFAFEGSALDVTGQCGENVYWNYNSETKELVISGSGDMYNYKDYDKSPFCDYISEIETVVINKGITSIGDYVFYNCVSLESVTIIDTVESIGNGAFCNCTSLEYIKIPQGVCSIGIAAFGVCNSLTSVVLPESVEYVGAMAFGLCFNLESVIILNPECVIDTNYYVDSIVGSLTFSNRYWFYANSDAIKVLFTGVIIGFANSTAEIYADECNISFEGHKLTNSSTINATCLEAGQEEYSCTDCDFSCKVETNKPLGHLYSNACDTTCNRSGCKTTRSINHSYVSATCTTPKTCKICGATSGNSLDHLYSNVCDTTCNRNGCKTTRSITHSYVSATCTAPKTCEVCRMTNGSELGHTYTNACDKDCDVCGATRSVPKHKGGKATCKVKAKCSECGITYGSLKAHTYSNSCDKSCNACGEARNTIHTYKTITTKATLKKNGKIIKKCKMCGHIASTTNIYYPKTITLSSSIYNYNGKVKTPSVVICDSKGYVINDDYYTIKYVSGRKNPGKYTVTVTFKGKYSGTKKLSFTIKPKAVTLSKVTAGSKQLTANWKTVAAVTGYEVQASTSSKFTSKTTKKVTVKSAKTKKTTIKKLKKGKKYYVKVRAYKTVDGKKIYGGWSKPKTVKVK